MDIDPVTPGNWTMLITVRLPREELDLWTDKRRRTIAAVFFEYGRRGLFHPADDRQEVAFRYAVERINADRTILPRSRLSAQIEKISPQDSFHASKRAMLEVPSLDCIVDGLKSNRVCHLLRSGVAAIFGPQSGQTASHVQSICDTMEIPHLETRWDYRLRRESCLVNLYPHPTTLSKAYVDLVKAWGWKSFTIIYENNEGLVRLQELLKAHGPSEFPIAVRQLGESSDYRLDAGGSCPWPLYSSTVAPYNLQSYAACLLHCVDKLGKRK
uniref:Receptor ligand binding region domain-containing protein n=1 Tax=Timema tahoe TaxID=61484 RepID=A0A7R9FGB6_9NEOP|nr:unnamed protein product [Timema tahoe]